MLALVLAATLDLTAARTAFDDLDALCRADAGRLWGVSLCGPTVFADPQTRDAVTWRNGELKTAKVPPEIGIANTGVAWGDTCWTMVMWPLPDDAFQRRALLAHESWHRVQEQLGFPSTGPKNAHLDDVAGRYWLRLELRALARALESGSKSAVEDALAFRAKRHALVAGAGEEERLLEMHEGLAEYTGTAIAEPRVKSRASEIVKALRTADRNENFVRSFAYSTGPAWGAIVEMRDARWTRALKASDDLTAIARRAWHIRTVPANAEARAIKYGGAAMHAEEEQRGERKRVERAALRAQFIDGPTLTLPIGEGSSFTFDPYGVQVLDDVGSVYRNLKMRGPWGSMDAASALITSDWKRVIVPAAEGGYHLELAPGWSKAAGARAGDLVLKQ